jgi:acetyl-CoA C-acetyltransferase
VEIQRGRKTLSVTEDAGVFPTTAEGLAGLKPVQPNGVVTFGAQTHPADGCASALITSVERAKSIAKGAGIAHILGTGTARVEKARMPKAPVPAAKRALDAAGLDFKDVDLVTTHNPFAVNDVYFAKQTGIAYDKTNSYGCSLVWGHPQSPTGLRALTELIEALRVRGGGIGLFAGCAAGDTGAAVVVKVDG